MLLPHDIRTMFLDFFRQKGHHIVPSSSLIPYNDPTLLFTNAGMNQFKNVFLGLESRSYSRAVSSQKCVRAGGKHNDLDQVGFTTRHHTFFEMLGNFSFGDYFKVEAITYAWELLTKEFNIPKENLYVTVFESDDETMGIWRNHIGLDSDRIFKLDEKDNFWRMGETGPCGPCTEIYYDHGSHLGSYHTIKEGILSGEDRFVEIWNIVFMQYDEQAPGKMIPLPTPSVDTGSGLERLTAVLQNTHNNYKTTLFTPLIEFAAQKLELNLEQLYDLENSRNNSIQGLEMQKLCALRVLADHIRACCFLIADQVYPSNEGRGYVLRRIIRRALRYNFKLNPQVSIFPEMSSVLIQMMSSVYPELSVAEKEIKEILKEETAKFSTTLEQGSYLLNMEFEKLKKYNQQKLSGEIAFKLYDTYGFPIDLTQIIAKEQGFSVDVLEFEKIIQEAKEKSKSSWKGRSISSQEKELAQWILNIEKKHKSTEFLGYSHLSCAGNILGSYTLDPETQVVILDRTPIYPLGGGQKSDQGTLVVEHQSFSILGAEKRGSIILHYVKSPIPLSGQAEILVNENLRRLTACNHSATHLLHTALRKFVSSHIHQAGSDVDHGRLRFDFNYSRPLSFQEIRQIENWINGEIFQAIPTSVQMLSYQEAISQGALAFFEEKYSDVVRVLSIGSESKELCGGTHVQNTSQIGLFIIVSEASISQGVRRIEAITSITALTYLQNIKYHFLSAMQFSGRNLGWEAFLDDSLENPFVAAYDKLKRQVKELQKKSSLSHSSKESLESILQTAKYINLAEGSVKFIYAAIDGLNRDHLMSISDQLKQLKNEKIIYLLQNSQYSLLGLVNISSLNAHQLFKEFAKQFKGQGGGRADLAQGKLTMITEQEAYDYLKIITST